MTEFTDTQQEQGERDDSIIIDGERITTAVPQEHLMAIPETDEMIIPRPITNAEGEKELWTFKGMGQTANGTKVEIVQDGKGHLHLMRHIEQPDSTDVEPETHVEGAVEEAPEKKKMGAGILKVLKGLVKSREEASGPDPDAVQRARPMSVIDPQGSGKTHAIMVSPDHLNGGGQ
jgi:hypothetical protein